MTQSGYTEVLEIARRNNKYRNYPGRSDDRQRNDLLFPHVTPKFAVRFGGETSVFTIGSCFARNIEEALQPLGVDLPTRRFAVPETEWPWRPNGLLNEYNPGSISRRIMDTIDGKESSRDTVVEAKGLYHDLLLAGGSGVSFERAMQRRAEIADVYSALLTSDVVVVTLGLIEAWFDLETDHFLNRLPWRTQVRNPDRYVFKRLDAEDAMALLGPPLEALSNLGKRIILTVSPVPLTTTFHDADCTLANEYSKSVLRICAERLSRDVANVDYFPAYEIVRSAGLSAYQDDNVHVLDDVVKLVTQYMIDVYRGS